MSELTQEELKRRLHYDPDTGIFTWLSAFQSQLVGRVAGGDHKGYVRINISCKLYLAHRIAFLYMMGKFPKDQVDHINHIKDDNRWCNLRECTHSQNLMNGKAYKNNTSGFKGVSWLKHAKKWQAQIMRNKKSTYLGVFKSKTEAAKIYNKAAKKYHGEFAHLNEI